MGTVADIDRKIAELQDVLDTGVTTTTQDGSTTVFDLAAVRRRISELRAQRDGRQKRTISTIRLD